MLRLSTLLLKTLWNKYMSLSDPYRSTAHGLKHLWAGLLIAGNCLGGGPEPTLPQPDDGWRPAIAPEEMLAAPKLAEPDAVTVVQPVCPRPSFWSRLTLRVVPSADLIGMPLHHRNYAADCYGENWRIQQFDLSTHWGRSRQKWHEHSLAMEHHWGTAFGKPPRGYIHDTSGHPLRGFFVPQPGDPTIPYQPGSDTLMPSRLVIDYPLYVYGQRQCPACEADYGDEHDVSPTLLPSR